jgi:ABC-type transport system involved in cytochrome c biogenesis permease subunit
VIEIHQAAAAIYLAAGIGAVLAIVLPSPRMSRGAVWGLALGAIVQSFAFATLHRLDPPPALTDPRVLLGLISWMSVVVLLLLMWRIRLSSLTAVVGPVAFLTAFAGSLGSPRGAEGMAASGAWPHAHVLLASAGLALMGVAGLAGIFYLAEHRRLKSKRPIPPSMRLPSLEALDRVNVIALAIGFPLLTLGVITGTLWLRSATGEFWMATPHETWTMVAWGIYAGLAGLRFGAHQGARQAAATAVAGFAFLAFAVVGVGMFR